MSVILISILIFGILGLFTILGRKMNRGSGMTQGAGKDQGLVYPDFRETDVKSERKEGFVKISNIFRFGEGDTLFIVMEKFFRKVRVRLMKVENWLQSISNKLHEKVREKRVSRNGSRSTLVALNQTNTEFDENYWIRVLKEDAKSPYPYKKLGEIYLARGYFREAREVLRCALKFNPQDSEIKAQLDGLRGKRTKRTKTA